MKLLTLIFTFLFILNGISQKIERKSVPGTRLTIEMHANSKMAKHAPIVTIEDKVDLNIVEMTDSAAYEKAKSDFELPKLKAQGFVVLEERDLTVDGYKGKLFLVEVGDAEYGLSCYFGDATFLTLCTAIYDRTDEAILGKLLKAVQSMKLDATKPIDWNSFFAFTYNSQSIFKLDANYNHNLGIRFTAGGRSHENLFDSTMIMCGQFAPTFDLKTAQDVINKSLVPQLAMFEISDVYEDTQKLIDGTDAYVFHAQCSRDGKEFQIYSIAQFHESACILITAYILDNHYAEDSKNFINEVRLKKDGI